MNENEQLLDDLGDIGEYGGGWVLLPESHYLMDVSLAGDPDVTPEGGASGDKYIEDFEIDGEAVLAGGSPYLPLALSATEGPFAECGFESRFYVTPGKGPNIGFVNHAVKAVTGRAVDLSALSRFGIDVVGASAEEKQQAFRIGFLQLGPQDRLDFMAMYARFDLWDGASAVVKVGREAGQKEGTMFNRIQGFHSVTDGKRGQGYVRGKCFENQEKVGLAEGTLTADE